MHKGKVLWSISMCIMIVLLCGCKDINEPATDLNSQDKADENSEFVSFSEIEWETDYIETDISDTFKIKANVVPESVYGQTFGLYRYSSRERTELDQDIFAQIVDAYYGKDVSVTADEIKDVISGEITVTVNSNGMLYSGRIDSLDIFNIPIYDTFFPIKTNDYDTEKMNMTVDDFVQTFADYINFSTDGYRCIYYGEEYREKIKASGVELEPCSPQEGCFDVEIHNVLEHGIYFRGLQYRYKLQEGEIINPLTSYEEMNDAIIAWGNNKIELFLDSDYNIKAFQSEVTIDIEEEPFAEMEIISLKQILEDVYKRNQYKMVTVTNAELCYSCYMEEELGKGNMRDVYIAPFWVITYLASGADAQYQYIYSAVTGSMLDSSV
ncbi:MAG: hypothetical protein E7269_07000 [Lachnospiraceae bacterium]|nr:hypothetical protein [Lachnospiraceae bacterium]